MIWIIKFWIVCWYCSTRVSGSVWFDSVFCPRAACPSVGFAPFRLVTPLRQGLLCWHTSWEFLVHLSLYEWFASCERARWLRFFTLLFSILAFVVFSLKNCRRTFQRIEKKVEYEFEEELTRMEYVDRVERHSRGVHFCGLDWKGRM